MSTTIGSFDALADAIADRVMERIEQRQSAGVRRLMNTREAADYLGMSVHALRRRSAAGEVANVRDGQRNLRFDRMELDQWIAQRSARG